MFLDTRKVSQVFLVTFLVKVALNQPWRNLTIEHFIKVLNSDNSSTKIGYYKMLNLVTKFLSQICKAIGLAAVCCSELERIKY